MGKAVFPNRAEGVHIGKAFGFRAAAIGGLHVYNAVIAAVDFTEVNVITILGNQYGTL